MDPAAAPMRGVKFVGSHVHQLDDKGRVALPASFRREAADQRFVLYQAFPPALTLYPESTWMGVEQRLRELQERNPEARLYVLSVMANAVEVTPDTQGRIVIPVRLKELAKLEGQVTLVGAIDKVELWNPGLFDAQVTGQVGKYDQAASQIFP
jgi:MraZ protein